MSWKWAVGIFFCCCFLSFYHLNVCRRYSLCIEWFPKKKITEAGKVPWDLCRQCIFSFRKETLASCYTRSQNGLWKHLSGERHDICGMHWKTANMASILGASLTIMSFIKLWLVMSKYFQLVVTKWATSIQAHCFVLTYVKSQEIKSSSASKLCKKHTFSSCPCFWSAADQTQVTASQDFYSQIFLLT